MADYSLSVSDLLLVDGFAQAFAKGAEGLPEVMTILHTNGMDTNKKVELVLCQHRNLRNNVVLCERYEGSERLDPAWIKSGYASLDAQIEAEGDSNLRYTLRTMCATGIQDAAFQ